MTAFRCPKCTKLHDKCTHVFAPVGKRILVIPDTQLKPGVPMDHMTWAGKYAADKQPDIIVHIGDVADMESLSSYDRGKLQFQNRRYKADIAAGTRGMELFTNEVAKARGYHPDMHITYGNHDQPRIKRIAEDNPELEGINSVDEFGFEAMGWQTHEFLKVITLQGIEFAHYFVSGALGRPVSSAAVMLRERQGSCIQGHNQKFDMSVHPKTGAIAMMVGAFYQHTEDYLGPQGQATRLQVVMLNEAKDGHFDPMLISMNYLKRRYGIS